MELVEHSDLYFIKHNHKLVKNDSLNTVTNKYFTYPAKIFPIKVLL